MRSGLLSRFVLGALLGAAFVAPGASAEDAHKPTPNAPAAAPAQSAIDLKQALYLIRTSLMTLNDANRSGNYTVLRDLAAPSFQARNTSADLAAIFTDLRKRQIDLFNVAIVAPQLAAVPAIGPEGLLRLKGFFPTRPLLIDFDILFQNVGGQWRMFGLSVQTPPADAPKPAPPPPPAPPSFDKAPILSATPEWAPPGK